MAETVTYLAIWKDEKKTVVIEYKPLNSEWGYGAIEIVNIDIQLRPVPLFKQREAERRKAGRKSVL